MAPERGFVPFGEYRPDLRYLSNDGLVRAENVIPIADDYITSPAITRVSAEIGVDTDVKHGLHIDPLTGNAYVATGGHIYEVTPAGVITDRCIAGHYASTATTVSGWQGAQFGSNIILTDYFEPVQFMVSGGAAFANMITSTFAPKARFAFPLGPNLFLAHCNLSGAFDGLSAGDNPILVCWSRNDNIRQFGSFNATPELTGAGYQQLNYDIGEITGAIAGSDFGVIALSRGLVRVDGPQYTFRVITKTDGCRYPNSLVLVGSDVYYVSDSGILKLAGGEGEPIRLGVGKWIRSWLDNSTGAGIHPFTATPSDPTWDASGAYDAVNDLLIFSYTEQGGGYAQALLSYNIGEDRLTYFQMRSAGVIAQARFLRSSRPDWAKNWCVGRDIRFVEVEGTSTNDPAYLSRMSLGNSGGSAILQKGYIQFKPNRTARIRRVRPIYNVTNQAAIEQISVTIETTNKPYGTATVSGPYTTLDTGGWIACPDSKEGDFHSLKFTLTANANMHQVIEYTGFEYDIVLGGEYGA